MLALAAKQPMCPAKEFSFFLVVKCCFCLTRPFSCRVGDQSGSVRANLLLTYRTWLARVCLPLGITVGLLGTGKGTS